MSAGYGWEGLRQVSASCLVRAMCLSGSGIVYLEALQQMFIYLRLNLHCWRQNVLELGLVLLCLVNVVYILPIQVGL